MDSQSVKNTDSAEQKGYDAGKKVSGIKRHIAVDTQGLPHAIHVTTANVTDRAGALAMFDQRRDGLSLVQNVLVDGGYTGDPFAAGVQSLLGASVEVVKRNEMHTFVVLPKRWVVERSFAWLEKCRRLWKNCERKLNTSLQMVVLAFAALILKRLQTGSKEIMQENLVFLREYARLLLIEEDETLTPVEDFKDVLMQEFMAMGTYLKLTERDMMLLIFKDILSHGIHLE